MVDQQLLLRTLSEFAAGLATRFGVREVLQHLAAQVSQVLGVARAGVSLADDGALRFATALDGVTAAVERIQEDAQQGPCAEAHHSGEAVLVADLRDDPRRWPRFTEGAICLGVVAVAGIPMRLNGIRLGALDLYATSRRDWRPGDIAVARALADMAVGYVAHAGELERSRRTAEQLQQALDSRVVIEQAKGMLAAERHISVDEAFELIRRHARSRNVKLRTVAEAIVRRGCARDLRYQTGRGSSGASSPLSMGARRSAATRRYGRTP